MLGSYAGIVGVVLVRRARRPLAALGAAGLAAVLAWPAPASSLPPGAARISFLDVGQGDATLIQTGSRAILVDAGPRDGPILARLGEAGVRRLDLAVVTHDQEDHEGGMASVVRRYPVGLVLDGAVGARTAGHRTLLAAVTRREVRRVGPDAGQELDAGPVRVRVLWPPAEPASEHAGEDPNLRAIVVRVSIGTFDLLLPADAESEVTSALALEPVEALKVAHHGSADPGLATELERLRPGIAVIEVGRHNTYGHPTAQALAALRSVPRIYRTDRDGTVTLTLRGERAEVTTSRGR
jgi:competence protein ComEC